MTSLPSLTGLRAFEAAARLLSFQKAARELSITPTAVSHRIRRLETEIGTALFHRKPRKVTMTDAALLLLPDVQAAFQRLEMAARRLKETSAEGVLTVSTVPSFAVKWLVQRLASFQRDNPGIDVRISTDMALSDFRGDGVDIAIRYGRGNWPGLCVDKLMTEDWHPVCARELVTGTPPLGDPADLANHTLLHIAAYPDDWERWLTMAGHAGVRAARNLYFDDTMTALQAAIDGLGVALGRRAFTERDLAAGRLVDPFDIHLPQDTAFYVVAPEHNVALPKVAAFRNWILAEAANGDLTALRR
jgi:LysR family glycine cleavage system transcriptional activator